MSNIATQVADLSAQAEMSYLEVVSSLPRAAKPANTLRPSHAEIESDQLSAIGGLMPRYLRNRAPQATSDATNDAAQAVDDVCLIEELPRTDKAAPSFDGFTPQLRDRVMKANPQYGRWQLPTVAAPIMAVLAALPWLAGTGGVDVHAITSLALRLVLQ